MRLAFLSRDFLNDVVTNELVRQNLHCFQLISDAVKLSSFSCEGDIYLIRQEKDWKPEPLLPVEGNTLSVISQKKNEWKRLADAADKEEP